MNNIKTSTLAVLCGSLVLILGMITTLIVLGKQPDSFVQYILLIVAAVLPSGVNLVKTDRISSAVQTVQTNTNGRLSQLVSIIEAALGKGVLPAEYDNVERIPVNIPPVTQTAPVDPPAAPQDTVFDYPGSGAPLSAITPADAGQA